MGFRNQGYLVGLLILRGSFCLGVYFRSPIFVNPHIELAILKVPFDPKQPPHAGHARMLHNERGVSSCRVNAQRFSNLRLFLPCVDIEARFRVESSFLQRYISLQIHAPCGFC